MRSLSQQLQTDRCMRIETLHLRHCLPHAITDTTSLNIQCFRISGRASRIERDRRTADIRDYHGIIA